MGASNTPLYDLVELSGINAYATFTTAPGGGGDILGYIDTATYTDGDGSNTASQIAELNDGGTLRIGGVDYTITVYTPDGAGNGVTVTHSGGSVTLSGDGGTSQIAFILAEPLGGGSARYFAAIDDAVGDLQQITSIQTRGIDFSPAGSDVKIDLDQNNAVTACYAAETLIATPDGPRAVGDLRPGDRVLTLDRGAVPLVWVGGVRWDPGPNAAAGCPILIQRGALGLGMPERPLRVSPQHRMLIASQIAKRVTGVDQLLVPAVRLTGFAGIHRDRGSRGVDYRHILTESHAIIFAEGAASETLLPERQALRAYTGQMRSDIAAALDNRVLTTARPILERGPLLDDLLRRHRRNAKPLVAPGTLRPAGAARQPLRVVKQ